MPLDVVSYVLAKKALAAKAAKGLRFIADVEANASVLTIEGFDKTKAYMIYVYACNADDEPRNLHMRVNDDTNTNYSWQLEFIIDSSTYLADQWYGESKKVDVGRLPAKACGLAVMFVFSEMFVKSTSRYTISFVSIGGGGKLPFLFTAYGEYGIGDPIPSPYSLTIGNVNGYFDYVRVVVYEVMAEWGGRLENASTVYIVEKWCAGR